MKEEGLVAFVSKHLESELLSLCSLFLVPLSQP